MGFSIGKNCQIDPTAVINVREGFLGDRSIVRAHTRIEGRKIEIGKEAFVDIGAVIGGGSCFDPSASLKAGDWLHLGMNSQINIARGVEIGHEFGCGIESKIFTHGAYTDSYNLGAPSQWASVKIGNQVWMPNAWVNPGVEIGDCVVIAARSLVNKSIPSGCLAAGSPVKIIDSHYLPRELSTSEKLKFISEIKQVALERFVMDQVEVLPSYDVSFELDFINVTFKEKSTQFSLKLKTIEGNEFKLSYYIKDQLRRNGVRFRYLFDEERWQKWE